MQVRARRRFASPVRSATPAAVAPLVAAVVIAFAGCQGAGPSPSASWLPTRPPATGIPTETSPLTPSPTINATPIASPIINAWTHLDWGAPFDPFPYKLPSRAGEVATTTAIYDLVAWAGGFVGVGSISQGSECDAATFFHSDDQVHWTLTNRFSSGDERTATSCPRLVVDSTFGLLALSETKIWSSKDGLDWEEVDSPSWRALWTSGTPELMGVAAEPGAVVVVGEETLLGQSIVARTTDGLTWQRVELPAAEHAFVRDLAAGPHGFVLVGRDGQADTESGPAGIVPGAGRPTAWVSADGESWAEARIEGSRVQAGVLARVFVVAGGLVGIGNDTQSAFYPDGEYDTGQSITVWASSDGNDWTIAGAFGKDLPPAGGVLASDGTRIVGLGIRQSAAWTGIEDWVEPAPTAWTSTDGRSWTAVPVSGTAPEVDFLTLEPALTGSPSESALWVFGDRLLALGRGDGVPVDQPYADQWYRFGTGRQAAD